MFRFIVGLFAVIGLIVILLVAGAAFAIYQTVTRPESLPEAIVLELDLDSALVEHIPPDPLAEALFGRRESLRDVIDGLERARSDPRVKGVIARFGGDQIGFAQAQEIRSAIERFRASGRFAYAFSESFGELSPGDRAYYLATAFEEVWLQPVGIVGLTGLSTRVPFARGTLEELNVEPQLKQREEYKSFMNIITERDFTEPHREMVESLLDDLVNQLITGIAASRRLEPDAVRQLIDRGPFLDREAMEARLVDRLGHYDEVRSTALDRSGAGADHVDLSDYLGRAGRPHREGPTIAVIYGVGSIVRGESGIDPLFGGPSMGSDDMLKAFDQAIDDPDVRAILFRIDSGGGSAVASETIRRAAQRAREAGKPVIVSMGEKAASGGYWIAMNADHIVAHPATMTGSIGVVAGKIVTEGLWDQIGVNWGQVSRGRNATIWSPLDRYSEGEEARLNAMLDSIYESFVQRVAEARKLPLPAVLDIAKGRVWTGAQAKALGLVDELGGIDTALRLAREAVDIPPDDSINLTVFPRPESPVERVMAAVFGRSHAADALIARFRPVLEAAGPLLTDPSTEVLRMPPIGFGR